MMNSGEELAIRKAELYDLDSVMPIFDCARQFMVQTGNPTQWADGYPERSFMENEIAAGHCYVFVDDLGKPVATFCYIEGDDPTYHVIEDGKWLNDAPYAVLHRLASDGSHSGIADLCLNWCFTQTSNLRVDTHQDNKVLQHILLKHGFKYCGIIYVRNHSPRLAYQKIL